MSHKKKKDPVYVQTPVMAVIMPTTKNESERKEKRTTNQRSLPINCVETHVCLKYLANKIPKEAENIQALTINAPCSFTKISIFFNGITNMNYQDAVLITIEQIQCQK